MQISSYSDKTQPANNYLFRQNTTCKCLFITTKYNMQIISKYLIYPHYSLKWFSCWRSHENSPCKHGRRQPASDPAPGFSDDPWAPRPASPASHKHPPAGWGPWCRSAEGQWPCCSPWPPPRSPPVVSTVSKTLKWQFEFLQYVWWGGGEGKKGGHVQTSKMPCIIKPFTFKYQTHNSACFFLCFFLTKT